MLVLCEELNNKLTLYFTHLIRMIFDHNCIPPGYHTSLKLKWCFIDRHLVILHRLIHSSLGEQILVETIFGDLVKYWHICSNRSTKKCITLLSLDPPPQEKMRGVGGYAA